MRFSAPAGLITVVADDGGVFRVSTQRFLHLPVAVRRWCELAAGDRVLLAAYPEGGLLVVHPPTVLDAVVDRVHAQALKVGGDVGRADRPDLALGEASLERPDDAVREVVYPAVYGGEKTLRELVHEFKTKGPVYRRTVQTTLKASYSNHYRRGLIELLEVLEFRSNNATHRPVLDALDLIRRHADARLTYYPAGESVPSHKGVLGDWTTLVFKDAGKAGRRVVRSVYEICTFQALREQLRCKEIWLVGADKWLKNEVRARWGTVPLIDMLTEAVLRTGCLAGVTGTAGRGADPTSQPGRSHSTSPLLASVISRRFGLRSGAPNVPTRPDLIRWCGDFRCDWPQLPAEQRRGACRRS
jgi:hypothetical protein